ncbi:MAG TPA: hypothetical protein DDW27_00155, partial [Bacteroidales bacterium]|nr:hypothetical protein [Bacteroidales bacterium]
PEPRAGFLAGQAEQSLVSKEPGLLFYLSGDQDFSANFASGGQTDPNFLRDVTIISDGAVGKAFRAEDTQLMSYWAPGNIYAQRGTLAFFWRSRYPVGPTPFPVFRVGYADHSSWDMVWLRIDYNGSGFDAFVTDIGLSRTRVSWYTDKFPSSDKWIHIALSWDETEGIRFYVDGKMVARQTVNGSVYDTGLDQFGPHSRIISPYQVQSAYCFSRGGDVDEIRIYDHMLPDESIPVLASGKSLKKLSPFRRNLTEERWRDDWWLRNGWNLPNSPPPLLPSSETTIKKIEIHDAYDIKRWYWKANDGIRETTWPGVYNMSRLPGRYDYFVLPDWDCYSGSGQTVRFKIPEEPWNHIEIWGKAWGQLTLEDGSKPDFTFSVRKQNQVKSVHHLSDPNTGGTIRFDNALIEEPIGSFEVYNIVRGSAPPGIASETFKIEPFTGAPQNEALKEIISFINGRYPADERAMMTGVPEGREGDSRTSGLKGKMYPFIHIMIPYSDHKGKGLDGIEIKLPPLYVNPTHNGVFPVNIRIKDPVWPMRDLADISFSVKPGEAPLLWIDTRDRILPGNKALYLTIAGAGADLTPELVGGTYIRLVYKTAESSSDEHVTDRFTQIRDLYAHIVEERPVTPRLNLYNRFMADCNGLLAVKPDHWLTQTYKYALTGSNRPEYKIPEVPDGIPGWAFLQIEYLRKLEKIASYYIDNRQIANGEFGGGLSDDGDLTNMWPGMAFLGIDPDKLLNSLLLHMTAYYDQYRPSYNVNLKQKSLPLFTNGLATIFTDELHAVEEGIQVVAQCMLLDYGNPLHIERGMETALRMLNDITQINDKGHRHFRSRFYSGTRIAEEDPWQWSVNHSYHVLQPAYLLARYNGNPLLVKMITDLADALLEHSADGKLYTEINYSTDESRDDTGNRGKPWSLFLAAWKLTGDRKYLEPLPQSLFYNREFNQDKIAGNYRNEISNLGIREYINTEGSVWIDRISSFNPVIQEDRLGGVALTRTNILYPMNRVSWKFEAPASWTSTAVYVQESGPEKIRIITYNLENESVNAEMTLWDVLPGKWSITTGIDTDDDQKPDTDLVESSVNLGRGEKLDLTFAPRKYTIISLDLKESSGQGYWDLPDIAIGKEGITVSENEITVRVHNIGAIISPEAAIVVTDSEGIKIGSALVPSIQAPVDLKPRRTDIKISIPSGTGHTAAKIELDPEYKIKQITRKNDTVSW